MIVPSPVPIDPTLTPFAEDPNTLRFVARYNSYLVRFVSERPYIRLGRVLSGQFAVGYVDRSNADRVLSELAGIGVVYLPLILGPTDRQSLVAAGIAQVLVQPYLNLRGQGVLMGFVDTGIDYTNDLFRYEDGSTRIQYLWDQSISGNPPGNFAVGSEYTADQINEALSSDNPLAVVPSQDTVGHGTFLASVAAGRSEDINLQGAAPDCELVVVKLRPAGRYAREMQLIPDWAETAFEAVDLMMGIEYILDRAIELGRPVSICIGLGTNQGGHDGFTILEDYLDLITYRAEVCLVTAAGNESQAGHHTAGVLMQGGTRNIELSVPENASDIPITLINAASDRISVAVVSPTGEQIGPIPARSGTITRSRLILERSSVQIAYYFPVEGSGGQHILIHLYDPTPGIWTIVAIGDLVLNGTYNLWLPITGFVSPGVEFLTPVPYTTVVVPGTTPSIITCGAFNSLNNALFIDSSWGPNRLALPTPDFAAPGVDVGGMYPGGPGTMTGTSAAAAIAAGAGALMLQWGAIEGNAPFINTHHIKAFFIRGADRDPNITYPNEQWGYGRLNLEGTFNQFR